MFGFPKTEYKVFKRNFLRKVIFQLEFNKNFKIAENEESLKSFFLEEFPRFVKAQGNGLQITFGNEKPKLETLNQSDNFILKSQDGQKTLEINDRSLRLSFDAPSYISSDNIRTILDLIFNFFHDKIEIIEKVSLKKINIIEFDSTNNPNGILYFLLNKSIVGNVDSFPNTELINHNLQSVNYRDDNFLLNLKYGMNLPPIQNLKIGQLIIDIEISKYTKTNILDVKEVFENINSEMYNVFYSLLSDDAKKILDGN